MCEIYENISFPKVYYVLRIDLNIKKKDVHTIAKNLIISNWLIGNSSLCQNFSSINEKNLVVFCIQCRDGRIVQQLDIYLI